MTSPEEGHVRLFDEQLLERVDYARVDHYRVHSGGQVSVLLVPETAGREGGRKGGRGGREEGREGGEGGREEGREGGEGGREEGREGGRELINECLYGKI